MSRKTHLILQFCLIALWVLILWADNAVPVSSQTPTCPQPPHSWTNPLRKFWRPNFGNVIVKVDSRIDTQYAWAPDARARIKAGQQKWNGVVCSGVTFTDFDPKTFTQAEIDADAPNGHVYWVIKDPQNGTHAGIISYPDSVDDRIVAAKVMMKPSWVGPNFPNYFNYLGTHEIGHSFNLANCNGATSCLDVSIMGGFAQQGSDADLSGPRLCDIQNVKEQYCPSPSPSPSESPTPEWPWPEIPWEPEPCQNGNWFWNYFNSTCNQEQQNATCINHCVPYTPMESGGCFDAADYCAYLHGCPPGTVDGGQGCCCFPTPILIDVNGDGFDLTSGKNGVMFDMGGDGRTEPVAWTKLNSDDAWLAIDRNGNGVIDSGKELFGSFTDQPHAIDTRNGFVALAEFDRPDSGGNGDGVIGKQDSAFDSLRLWQDVNKNGVSEASELHTLKQLGLKTIELDYKESKRTDEHGNQFKYRAKVKDNKNAQMGRWAWDVILKANLP